MRCQYRWLSQEFLWLGLTHSGAFLTGYSMDQENKKNGRPLTKLTDKQKEEVETLAAVLSQEQIADYFGMSRTTFYEVMKRDPEVSEQYKKGKARAIGAVAQSLVSKARSGELGAQIFYLKTQGHWKETQSIEHSSPDGSMTPTKIERVFVDQPTDTNTKVD
tara:strand:- start:642 stop:1127 length:486 start_codon:yes stop_codon:yes gene_type:complete